MASLRLRWLSSDMVCDLAERVLAVEHPAVCAGQQRVGDVADALFDRSVGLRRGAGALNPLPPQIVRNVTAYEIPAPRVRDLDVRAANAGLGIEKLDALMLSRPLQASLDAGRHQRAAVFFERGKR